MPYKDKTELKEAQHQWYVKNRDRVRHQARNFVRRRRIELRKKASLYKSERGCKSCGEMHPATLDFHHRDGKSKEACVANAIQSGWSWERVLAEIEKCDILCANCHRKLHWSNLSLP
jgi:hypothetical protein